MAKIKKIRLMYQDTVQVNRDPSRMGFVRVVMEVKSGLSTHTIGAYFDPHFIEELVLDMNVPAESDSRNDKFFEKIFGKEYPKLRKKIDFK